MTADPQDVLQAVGDLDVIDTDLLGVDMSSVSAPLKERIEQLDVEIATAVLLVGKLKDARRRAVHILGVVDPQAVPKATTPAKTKTKGWSPSNVKTKLVKDWLDAHRDQVNGNGGMKASQVAPEVGLSESYTKAILSRLHDQGVVRLDHIGRGAAHFYKVV